MKKKSTVRYYKHMIKRDSKDERYDIYKVVVTPSYDRPVVYYWAWHRLQWDRAVTPWNKVCHYKRLRTEADVMLELI